MIDNHSERNALRQLAESGATDPTTLEPEDVRQLCLGLREIIDAEDDVILKSRTPATNDPQSSRRRLA